MTAPTRREMADRLDDLEDDQDDDSDDMDEWHLTIGGDPDRDEPVDPDPEDDAVTVLSDGSDGGARVVFVEWDGPEDDTEDRDGGTA